MKFGRTQIKNPTPQGIIFWVRIVTVICGIFMGWMQTVTFISTSHQAVISSILGLFIAVGNGVTPFFGVPIKDDSVPKENVTAVDEKTQP